MCIDINMLLNLYVTYRCILDTLLIFNLLVELPTVKKGAFSQVMQIQNNTFSLCNIA